MHKKIVPHVKNKIKRIASSIRIYFIFLRSLFRSRKSDKLVIFHIENWMIDWDLKKRLDLYSRIIGLDNVVMINFDSYLQCYFAKFFISRCKEIESYNLISEDILYRCLWDLELRKKQKVFQLDVLRSSYQLQYDSFVKKINKKKYALACSILAGDRIDSYHLVQESFLDLWLANVAQELGKTIYFSESAFGSIKIKRLSWHKKKELYSNVISKLNESELSVGENSLKARSEGKYVESSLGDYFSYYKDPPKEGLGLADISKASCRYNIVLFLHAFVDSPNVELYSIEDFPFIDHYDFFLSIVDWVADKDDTCMFVRFHPHSKLYPQDRKYIETVKNIVDGKSNIKIINSDFSIKEILINFDKKSFMAITGNGSVSLEMAWNGVQCFNYKRNIYTELGVSRYLERFEDLFVDSAESSGDLKKRAVEVEAARARMQNASIFRFNNRNKTSEATLYDLMDDLR